MAKPRLLFVCHTLPFPPDGGNWIRTYHVIRMLAREFDLTGLLFERTGAIADRAAARRRGLEGLQPYGDFELFEIPQVSSRVRYLGDHLRSALTGGAYTRFLYESTPFRHRLRELVDSGDFALAHVDSSDLAGYLPELTGLPVAYVFHNIESQLLYRRAEGETNRAAGLYLRHQARLTRADEMLWSGRVALNVMVSRQDEALLRTMQPNAACVVVPNGVDVEEFTPGPSTQAEDGIVYVGGTNWFPNLDALEFYAREILPVIKSRIGERRSIWVGSCDREQQNRFRRDYGIELTGYVDDVRPYMRNAEVFVVPLRVGGGTRLKILNAWATGKAVVSTTVGCEGLHAVDGENIIIRDDPREFGEAVAALIADPSSREGLGRSGRQTAETLYSWEVVGRSMNGTYRELLGQRSGGT